jgi:hypothetical protein
VSSLARAAAAAGGLVTEPREPQRQRARARAAGTAAPATEIRRGTDAPALAPASAAELAQRALANVEREYPNHPQYLLNADADAAPPRIVHPCFFGCFDWHSAVHTHWLLVRLLNTQRDLPSRDAVEAALARSLDPAKAEAEAAYLRRHPAFERPYGLAWLALLHAETAACPLPAARAWSRALDSAAQAARDNLRQWTAKLHRPVRSGTHNQTAFALTLLFDAADARRDTRLLAAVRAAALKFYRDDGGAPLRYEPSGEDFLSPTLMEADLMRRVLGTTDFAAWLGRFLPDLPDRDAPGWLDCGEVSDDSDGKLVHLHGLNLSRAWNLENIAAALPPDDPRRGALRGAAQRHRDAGLRAALTATDYAATHWLPTFAVYLTTAASAART